MKTKGTSIRRIMIIAMLILLFVLTLTVIYFNFTLRRNNEMIKSSIEDSIDTELNEIKNDLVSITAFMSDEVINGAKDLSLTSTPDTHAVNVAARNISDSLTNERGSYSYEVSMYFWYPAKDIEIHSFSSNYSDYADGESIINYLKSVELTETGWLSGKNWSHIIINSSPYLLKCSYYMGRYMFSWIKCSEILSSFTDDILLDGRVEVYDSDNNLVSVLGSSETDASYSFYKETERTDLSLRLSCDMVYDTVGLMLPLIFVSLITVAVLFFAAYSIYYFEYKINRPLKNMKLSLENISSSRKKSGIKEVNEAIEAYEDLQKQVEELKIDIYEEKLQNSRTELQYYQLQIQPHFFVNCFSIMYAMAQKKNYIGIQRLCMKLSSFVRSHFVNSFELITLDDELGHLRDYLDIQNIRHKTSSSINDRIDENLLDCRIPPLMLQTFVENSIKYSGLTDDSLKIDIEVSEVNSNNKSLLQILLTDNGVGIQLDKAEKINSRQVLTDSGGQHIGINNVQHRLSLLYGDDWYLEIRRCEEHSGTTVEIVIPIERKEE